MDETTTSSILSPTQLNTSSNQTNKQIMVTPGSTRTFAGMECHTFSDMSSIDDQNAQSTSCKMEQAQAHLLQSINHSIDRSINQPKTVKLSKYIGSRICVHLRLCKG